MEHRTLDELRSSALTAPARAMTRREKLERWATLLERHQAPLKALAGIEFLTTDKRLALRGDNSPLALAYAPNDPDTIYLGSNNIYRTTNGGQSWAQMQNTHVDNIAFAFTASVVIGFSFVPGAWGVKWLTVRPSRSVTSTRPLRGAAGSISLGSGMSCTRSFTARTLGSFMCS